MERESSTHMCPCFDSLYNQIASQEVMVSRCKRCAVALLSWPHQSQKSQHLGLGIHCVPQVSVLTRASHKLGDFISSYNCHRSSAKKAIQLALKLNRAETNEEAQNKSA
eukprot:6490434-Amphidinium_carterae.5